MPILDSNTLEFFSRSPEQTRRVGMRLGALLKRGDLVCLNGDLGAGKTTLVQGITQGWGSMDRVSSPTFVFVNEYSRPDGEKLFHLDAYRLQNALEAEDLDLILLLETGTLLVEWPEHIQDALPAECLWVNLGYQAEFQRAMSFHPRGAHYEQIMAAFRQRAFGG